MKLLRDSSFRHHCIALAATTITAMVIYFMTPIPGILVLLIMSFLVGVIFYHYANKRNSKVEKLVLYLRALNRREYQYDLEAYEEGELGVLHSELNKTTVSLKTVNESLKQQKKFLNQSLEDITHQLKTPITALSILNDLKNSDEEIVVNERIQIQRLESLTQSILKLVKLDAKILDFNCELVEVSPLIERCIHLSKPLLEKFNINVERGVFKGVIYCDENHTVEAILNVINNKVRFAKGTLFIACRTIGSHTEILISDDGETIAPSQRFKIFERFYSGPQKAPESVGIGLSISKEIMNQQFGNVLVSDKNTFVFRFRNMTQV